MFSRTNEFNKHFVLILPTSDTSVRGFIMIFSLNAFAHLDHLFMTSGGGGGINS